MNLYQDLDIATTIDIIYRYHKHNGLAAYNKGHGYRYEARETMTTLCARALMTIGYEGEWCDGITKICFPHHSNWVVKIPILKAWAPLLTAEVEMMNSAPSHLRKYFPETYIFQKGRYMFQEKCELVDHIKQVPQDIQDVANSLGIRDIHEGNFGLSSAGQWKIIDLQSAESLKTVQHYKKGYKVSA